MARQGYTRIWRRNPFAVRTQRAGENNNFIDKQRNSILWISGSGCRQAGNRQSGNRDRMRIQELPRPTRFMFWCTAPFLVATLTLLPLLAKPAGLVGWVVLVAFELLAILSLFGLYDPDKFNWCWRVVGGIVAVGYFAYLISMVAQGQWIGDGRRSFATALNALIGLFAFGYPGFMYSILGRFTWRAESLPDDAV